MSEIRYQVKEGQPHSVYRGDQFMGSMINPSEAALVVAALNRFATYGGGEPIALIDDSGDRWHRCGADRFRLDPRGVVRNRVYVEDWYGPVTEVWA
jgi:hypothetical protein